MAVSGPNTQWNGGVQDFQFAGGNGYFSNIMMNETNQEDFDNYSNTYADQQSQVIEEVQHLDPVVGKEQKGAKYWSRIYEYFNEHKTCPSTRTMNSLMHR
uniref:Uncharacterized protein n=1 Tax=Setaria viridis TaxID=4556 RepID=A0A4V6D1N3_SETVI|nr:hypothetical protein SEVIR_9G358400v2 [Setaria viridis]